jgi:hypothetical protein
MGGTSRVTGDCHARICERLGAKFPGATRQRQPREAKSTETQGRGGLPRSSEEAE